MKSLPFLRDWNFARILAALVFLCTIAPLSMNAQVQTGTPTFGSFGGGPDVVDNANLNMHWNVPIFHKPGRGTDFTYDMSYDSSVWFLAGNSWSPIYNWGWRAQTEVSTGYIPFGWVFNSQACIRNGIKYFSQWYVYSGFAYHDPYGIVHAFPTIVVASVVQNNCNVTGIPSSYGSALAADDSGYTMSVGASGASGSHPPPVISLTGRDGKTINAPLLVGVGVGNATDRNGNIISTDGNGHFYDTLSASTSVLTVTGAGTPASPMTFAYTNSTGTPASYTMKFATYSIQTNFGCSGITEYGTNGTTTANLVSEIDLPDNSKYLFNYESTPGHSGFVTGRLASVTLPTGGTVNYTYTGGSSGHINCADGSTPGLSRNVTDGGSWSSTWNYSRTAGTGSAYATKITDPQSNDTIIQFQGIYETQRNIYQGAAPSFTTVPIAEATLQTAGLQSEIQTCFNAAAMPCTGTTVTLPITQKTVVTTVPGSGNLRSQHIDKFNSYGMPTESDEYDFYPSGSTPPLLRQTLISYASLGGSLNAFQQTVTVKDGSGNIKSRQDTTYDQYGSGMVCVTGASQHNDGLYGCSNTGRGNVTSVTSYTDPVTPSGGITKNFTYDSLGNLRTAQMNCCQLKTWAFSSATSYAYPDSVTSGSGTPSLTTNLTYDLNMGLLLTSTDPNNVQSTLTYDSLGRPLTTKTGTNPTTNYTYTDSGSWSVQICSPVQGTNVACQKSILDGLGRPVTAQLLDGSSNLYSAIDTQYDPLGRAYKTSNPYTASAVYWTTVTFDALGRSSKLTLPDNSFSLASYVDNTMTFTDPANKQRKNVFDGLGRLSIVYEPDPTNGNALNIPTSYSYNTFDELTTVTEGVQTRTFTYDGLGQTLSLATPEAGTICFGTLSGSTCQANGYDNWGNLLYQTDARGVQKNFIYDSLNRLLGVSYTNVPGSVSSMPNVCATSGATNNANVCWVYGTDAASYNNGRVTSMTDQSGSEAYTYDQFGNVTQLAKTIGSTLYTTSYSFNFANELMQVTYPSSRVVLQSFDTIGRLCAVGASGSTCSAGTTYASGFTYSVAQQVTGFNYGNNINAAFGFSADRLQLTCLDYSTTNRSSCSHDGTTKFGLTYSYGTSGANNGQIFGITDSVDSGRTVNYTYDALYRLSNAATTGSVNYPAWGLGMTYDRYGNRTQQSATSGCSAITCPQPIVSVSATTNRITGTPYAYDASGNMTNDGSNTIVYDGENRATSSSGSLGSGDYAYDGNGVRIKKCVPNCTSPTTTTIYIFSGSRVIAEYVNGAAPASPTREYILSGTTLVAKIESGATNYYHQDHLSNRLVTNSSGGAVEQMGHFPFGESWYNASNDKFLFASYERDPESGNDNALARYDISRFGRFSSPDPFAGTILDPQSFNRYSYVENDPANLMDPFGLTCFYWDGGKWIDSSDPSLNDASSCHARYGNNAMYCFGSSCTQWSNQGGSGTTFGGGVSIVGSSGGSTGSRNSSGNSGGGFTLGIRAPGDTYRQCLAVNAHAYSAGGALELGINVATNTDTNITSNRAVDMFTGNSVNSLFGTFTDASLAAAGQAPGVLDAATTGRGLTYGRRTSDFLSLNLAGKGGLPQALSSPTRGLKSVFGAAGNALNLGLRTSIRLGIDIGLTAAEAIGCSIPRS